jgi:protein kinase-like protein
VGEFLMAAEHDDALRTMPSAGAVIAGRYLLGERVAQGGFGAIYAATDQRLGRKVAVKMMLDAAAQVPGFAERFEREAKAASSINHPSCVVVHDYGTDEHGTYLVLEWVEGKTLAQLVAAEGPLKPERAVELMAQVCEGLSAAHAHGIIHRDVKPDNVMVVPTQAPGGGERAKLVDFGIARPVDGGNDAALTGVGMTLGTPMFMSPEQAMAMPLDVRSDVYSTAATLYFALSGRQPYLGDRMAVFRQVVNAEPPDLPPALYDQPLAQVLRRAMAKDRAARPQTAAELARLLRDAVGSGRGMISLPRAGRRAMAVTAAVVVAAAALLSMSELLRRKPVARYPEVQALLEAGRPADADDAIAERLRASPDDPELLLLRGHARSARGDEPGARAAYAAALKGRPAFADDALMQKNALEWLKRPSPESTLELWRAIGQAGLQPLRDVSTSPDRNLRWNAIRLRQQIGDPQAPDLVAAYILDLEPARDCGLLRTTAERLRDAKDARALVPLRAARNRLNFIDGLCAGPVLDEAIRTLESVKGP